MCVCLCVFKLYPKQQDDDNYKQNIPSSIVLVSEGGKGRCMFRRNEYSSLFLTESLWKKEMRNKM